MSDLRFAALCDRWIERDPEILGGTPVIRGTRLTVHAILGRIEGGDSVEELFDDYPELDHSALEAAVHFAPSYPMIDRPGPESLARRLRKSVDE